MPGNDSNTLLLIHSDTTNGSTTFVDSGAGPGCPHTITRQSVQHTTAQAKFGATSFGRVSGVNPYLKINDTALKTVVNDDWCVDTWVYLPSLGYGGEILRFVSPQDSFEQTNNFWLTFEITPDGSNWCKMMLRVHNGTESIVYKYVSANFAPGWHHIELNKSGSNFYLFFDGDLKSDGSWQITEELYDAAEVTLYALAYATQNNVFFDEYRFSDTARHTTNFSPPVEPYDIVPGVTVTVDPLALSASLRGNFEDPVDVSADPFSAATSLDGEPYMPVTVIAETFTITAAAAGACVVLMPPAAFTHSQFIDLPKIAVTRDIPAGALVLRDQADAMAFLGPATLQLGDPVDALTFAAALGVTGGLSLADPLDQLSQGLGGELALLDPQDGLELLGRTEVIGSILLEDVLDSLALDPRAGIAGVLSLLEKGDGMELRGRGEVQAVLALIERIDRFGLQAATGTLAALALRDFRDDFQSVGRQDLAAQLELRDEIDLLQLAAIASTGYGGGSIRYRKERYP